MNDAHEEEFRKQGYSKESLKMLESKEGQLNAIYACFGSVVAESQFFEDAVKRLFTTVTGESPPSDRTKLKRLIDKLQAPIAEEWVWELFHKTREVRNHMAHQYFIDNQHRLKTKEGRMEMLMELADISAAVREVKDLINGMCVAVAKALESGQKLDEGITISLSDEVKKSYLSSYPLPKVNPV